MAKNTRYDKLRNRLRTDFSRTRTYSPAIGVDDSTLVFDLSDPDNIGNDSFLEAGPFNFVSVRNATENDIRLYLRSDRSVYVDVAAQSGTGDNPVIATSAIPLRYVGYLRVENLGTDEISEDEVQIQVGNEVDGVEMDLLGMSGLLNIKAESE